MQLQLQRSATCALTQEVCEQRALYTLHDLMPTTTLWMAPPLFIVSAGRHTRHMWPVLPGHTHTPHPTPTPTHTPNPPARTCDRETQRMGNAAKKIRERRSEREAKVGSEVRAALPVIHAAAHGAAHSLWQLRALSQHLLRPWRFLSFAGAAARLGSARRCCPDREAGAGVSQRASASRRPSSAQRLGPRASSLETGKKEARTVPGTPVTQHVFLVSAPDGSLKGQSPGILKPVSKNNYNAFLKRKRRNLISLNYPSE